MQKPSCPRGRGRPSHVRTTAGYCFFSSFAGSALAADEELAPEAGALLDVDGVLLEPLAALPLGCWSLELELELDEPPAAGAEDEPLAGALLEGAALDDDELDESAGLLASMVTEFEVELEPDGGVAGVVEPDADELELAGGVAGVVEPDEEDEALPGAVVRDTVRSPSLSQPVSNPAPSARDTATARVESLMSWASMVGVR
jgi:hypothetical protein